MTCLATSSLQNGCSALQLRCRSLRWCISPWCQQVLLSQAARLLCTWFRHQKRLNAATAWCLQMAPTQAGSLVYKKDPLAPASQVLQENDVVMELEGVPIADDGTIEFRNEERVEFTHIVRSRHIGGCIGLAAGFHDLLPGCPALWQPLAAARGRCAARTSVGVLLRASPS